MRTIEHKNWILKSLKLYREMTIEELESVYTDIYWFVDGQVEGGNYSSQDIWGNCGHVDKLNLARVVLNEKKEKLGLPTKQYCDEYQYSDRWISNLP